MVRTHVRKKAQNLNNSGGMSGVLKFGKTRAIFLDDLHQAEEITIERFRQRPWTQPVAETAAHVIARLPCTPMRERHRLASLCFEFGLGRCQRG